MFESLYSISASFSTVKKKNEIEKKKFKSKKNILESRKIFQNREIICYKNREKKSLELNATITFLHYSFIACARLVIVKSCFAQNVSQIGSEYHFCSTCGHKTRSELTDSVPLQLQGSIREKDIIWNYFQGGYHYEVIVVFFCLYHNINISKRTLERRLNYDGF